MNIAWSPEAIEDLASLRDYIAEDDPAAARRVVLHQSIEQLLPRQSPDRPSRTRIGHPRTGHYKDTLFRPLSGLAHHNPNLTRLS
jgi:plasmid stabilization system protein ParE